MYLINFRKSYLNLQQIASRVSTVVGNELISNGEFRYVIPNSFDVLSEAVSFLCFSTNMDHLRVWFDSHSLQIG